MKTLSMLCAALMMLPVCSCNYSKGKVTASSQAPETTGVSNVEGATSVSPSTPTAESFNEAKANGLNLELIDSIYSSGINADTNKAVFKGRINEYVEAYRQMITDAAHYLHKNETLKHKNIHFFNRIYFQSNGTIDYYLYDFPYNFESGGLTQEEEALFKKLLNEFIKTYKFPLTAKVPFSQCSPVIIQAAL